MVTRQTMTKNDPVLALGELTGGPIAALLSGALAGYGVAVPIGAIAVLVVGLTARTSLRVGAAAALGVASADGGYAIVAVLGGAALGPVIEPLGGPLRWVAAAVLTGIALRTAITAITAPARPPAVSRRAAGLESPSGAFLGLLALTMLNPMTVVYFCALVVGDQARSAPPAMDRAAFVVGVFCASLSWQLIVVAGGALLGRALTGRRGRLATALVSSVVVLALAGTLVSR